MEESDYSEAIKEPLMALKSSIDALKGELSKMTSKELTEQALEFDDPIDEANLYTLFAYSIDSIIFAYLKSKGVDTSSHPIMRELERVKGYMSKAKEAKPKTNTNNSEGPGKKLDKDMADRMIKSAISLTKEPVYIEHDQENATTSANDGTGKKRKKQKKKSKEKAKKKVKV